MNERRLRKLRESLDALKRGSADNGDEIRSFAKKVGRKQRKKKRGEPSWLSEPFPDLFPVRIPSHRKINTYTAKAILDQLEEDLDRWDETLTGGNDVN